MTSVVTALVSYVDDQGNPAAAPAGVVPAWSAADPDGTLSLAPSADGGSCVIKATGKLTVTQPAQLSVASGTLSGNVQLEVKGSAAASSRSDSARRPSKGDPSIQEPNR